MAHTRRTFRRNSPESAARAGVRHGAFFFSDRTYSFNPRRARRADGSGGLSIGV